METFARDLRHACRRLARSPGFALLAVLPLAVGIGANSTIFSFVNAALLRPLPAERPAELRRLTVVAADGVRSSRMSWADYEDYRDHGAALSDLVAVSLVPLALTAGGDSRQVLAEVVSGNFFQGLGIGSALGRTLAPADGRAGERVAVLGHAFWRAHFGGDPAALGAKVLLNGEPFTVVGVAAEEFTGTFAGAGIDVWTPAESSGRWFGAGWRHDRGRERFQTIGRLRPGFTAERAEASLDALAAALAEQFPDTHADRRVELMPASLLPGGLRGAVAGFLAVVTVVVGLVLLLACANVAHLLLARAVDRRRETAVRLALGAGRWRLGRLFLTESVVLAVAAGGSGFLLAAGSARLLSTWNPIGFIPLRLDVAPDSRVLAFTLAVSLATGVLLGLVPVLQAGRRDLVPALRGGAGTAAGKPRRARLRSLFLTAQIALALVMLAAAALFLASLTRIRDADPGFDSARVLALDLDLEAAGFAADEGRRFYRQLPRRLVTQPGVEAASLADLAPVDLATARRGVAVAGFEPAAASPALRLSMNRVAPGYFRTLGIPLLAGRAFDAGDAAGRPGVAVVNETLARKFWPGEEAIGQRFRVADAAAGGERSVEVVGVARDVKYRTFGEQPTPHFYLPLEQDYSQSMTLLVRTAGAPGPRIGTVQRQLAALHPHVQGFFARTLDDHLAFAKLPARVAAALFGLFGGVALLLALVGVYGAVAHSVAGRSRELGLRLALGARGRDLVRLLLSESLAVAALGLAAGLGLALALGRLLSTLLFGVSAADPAILAAVASLVLAVVLAASWVPARRAARVDPLVALRHD